jgi:hypothetical protein
VGARRVRAVARCCKSFVRTVSMLLSTRAMGALLRAAWELQEARENRSEVIVAARRSPWMTCKWNLGV